MVSVISNNAGEKSCVYEDALDRSGQTLVMKKILLKIFNMIGFGRYNFAMLSSSCLLILAMYLDIFGFSVVLPSVACDLSLTASQQAMLSAIPLIGVMLSSYAWGLCADTLGRRSTLLVAMTIGATLNIVASLAPSFILLAIFKFLSAGFTASANAAAFVLVGEMTPRRHRNQFMFLMAAATMLVQFLICLLALPVFTLSFNISILSLNLRPWRLLMLIISIPGVIGVISLIFLHESPKFLMSKGRDDEALDTLKTIYAWNSRLHKDTYPVNSVHLEEAPVTPLKGTSFLRQMWNQTAPLFQPPLLKNNIKLYYILMCAYMTSTGYTMWVPTMTNAFFNGEDSAGKTFCEVASTAVSSSDSTTDDCDNVIQNSTLYAVMIYSGTSGSLTFALSFVVGALGRRRTTLLVFMVSAACGIPLLFVKIPLLSIGLFYVFLYVCLILGNVNSYLVDLNPTHLRGMATCLSVVVARGFGFFSVQFIARLLTDHCTPMVSGYIALVISGLVVSYFLPLDKKKEDQTNVIKNRESIVSSAEIDAKTRF